MWPWEHLAVGYIAYSLLTRLLWRRAPRSGAVVALAIGTQFPDLVDKPLAWTFGITPSGYSIAHSLFVALPLASLAVLVGAALHRRHVGFAFAVGYLSHLPGDVFYPMLVGGQPTASPVLWPLVAAGEPETSVGFVEMFRTLFGRYLNELLTAQLSPYLALELGLMGSVVLLWLYDGMPPLRALFVRTTEDAP